MQSKQNLSRQFKTLQTIAPNPEWREATRALLLQHVVATQPIEPVRVSMFEYAFALTALVRRQLFQPAVMMLLVLGTFLGSSLVVNAAFYSLPDSTLYPVKIALERTQLAITSNREKKVELSVEFARKRVDEFEKVVAQADVDPAVRTRHLNTVVKEFAHNVAYVQKEIDQITTTSDRPISDFEKTLRIAVTVEQQATELAKKIEPAPEATDDQAASVTANIAIESSSAVSDEVGVVVAEAVASAKFASQSAQDLLASTPVQASTATSTSTLDEASTAEPIGTSEAANSDAPAAEEPSTNLLEAEPTVLGSATGTGETTAPLIE